MLLRSDNLGALLGISTCGLLIKGLDTRHIDDSGGNSFFGKNVRSIEAAFDHKPAAEKGNIASVPQDSGLADLELGFRKHAGRKSGQADKHGTVDLHRRIERFLGLIGVGRNQHRHTGNHTHQRNVFHRLMAAAVLAHGDTRMGEGQLDIKFGISDAVANLLIGATCTENGKSAGNRNIAHGAETGSHVHHIALGNAAVKETIGVSILKLGGIGSHGKVGVKHDDLVVLLTQFNQIFAVLPDSLFSLPVTELHDHALAPDAPPASGEEILLTCGAAPKEYHNRLLRELTLPETLRSVGDYAFYGCSELSVMHLCDTVAHWGACCFMNCRSLTDFYLSCSSDMPAENLVFLVGELSTELHIVLQKEGRIDCRLLFPEYWETYEENSPAHHFDYNIYGVGHPYHFVFSEHTLSLSRYDALFPPMLQGNYVLSSALRLAWWRLRTPKELSETAKESYLSFLALHEREALLLPLNERDIDGLTLLLSLFTPQKDTLSALLEAAEQQHYTEAAARLLETKHRLYPAAAAAKTFDL